MGAIPDAMQENIHLSVSDGSYYYEILGGVFYTLAVHRGLEAANAFLLDALFKSVEVGEDDTGTTLMMFCISGLADVALSHGVVLQVTS